MDKKKKILTIIVIIIFILTMIPLLYIARYNHSSADDYSYGIFTNEAWQETGNVFNVIGAAAHNTAHFYETWQGTFTAIFIMSLQPAVFSEALYGVTTIILFTIFILATIFLSKVILKDYLKMDKYSFLIITFLLLIISIQFVPVPVQAFYWYNGSIFYTFFYSLMLIQIGCILKLFKSESKKARTIYSIFIMILAILLGGSNFITALISNIILFGFTVYSFITKNNNRKIILSTFILCMIAFGISILAPGNSVRQAKIADRPGAIMSIIYSFKYAYQYFMEFLSIPNILFFTLVSPILYNCAKRLNYSYKYPVVVTILSICLFSAQFTPPIYALNGAFAGRVLNIIYFSFFWIVLINMFYYLGWVSKQKKENKKIWLIVMVVILLTAVAITLPKIREKKPITIHAIESLSSGEARQYDKEARQRMEVYNNKEIEDAKFEYYTVRPYLLFFSDLTEDPENWINDAAMDFYKKRSVVIENK